MVKIAAHARWSGWAVGVQQRLEIKSKLGFLDGF
jgi:hypothetical protein